MALYHSPALTAIAAQQRQHAFQRVGKRRQAANVAASAAKTSTGGPWTQLVSAHWLSGAGRRVNFRLSARQETPSEAWSK
jgi:hypothetical protein